MKYLEDYNKIFNCDTEKKIFEKLISGLSVTNRNWGYYVNWDQVLKNLRDIEIDLNTLNYLIGKDNIEDEFEFLLRKQNSIIRLIPILIATREKKFTLLTDFNAGKLSYKEFNFSYRNNQILSDIEILDCVNFARNSGILGLFQNKTIKNVPDYIFGVEVGLGTNGRKNRGGGIMEAIVEDLINVICQKNNYEYIAQATTASIKKRWGIHFDPDKTNRTIDFAVKANSKLFLIETNYYGGGGSKLKATAGEYKGLHDLISNQGIEFIWITDGQGWSGTKKALRETFDYIDYILNLEFASSGILESIFNL
jgi:type II restriction enzyme